MQVDVHTKHIMLLGMPLGQSFAARMQNAGFEAAGVNMRYFYNEVDSWHLGDIIQGIRYMSAFAGAAVTKPNKMRVMQYLDDFHPLCAKIGACNTIVKDGERLIGYNTDGLGFSRTLREDAGIDPAGKRFFCFGAGGVARPICASLANEGAAEVFVTDSIEHVAVELVEDINRAFGDVARAVPFRDFQPARDCDMVINATGVGMGATQGISPMPAECMHSGQFYFDACYNPRRTKFLLDAMSVGAPVMNGLYMCLYQGVWQFELWSGVKAPEERMRRELEAAIADIRG